MQKAYLSSFGSRVLRGVVLWFGALVLLAGARTPSLGQAGKVWAWGYNADGQLGDGTNTERHSPVQVKNLAGVMQIAAICHHSFAVKSDGTLWAWGWNSHGQLGDGTHNDSNKPLPVPNISGVVQLSGGGYHSLVLKSDGTLWAWGGNQYNQLGDGSNNDSDIPRQVSNLTGQTFIGSYDWQGLSVQAVVLNTTLKKPANVTVVYGKSFTLSTTLKNSLGGVLINEPVAFSLDNGATTIGTANTDASGKAVVLVPASLDRHPGAYKITVSYAGNRLYATSSKDSTLTITKADTALSVGAVIGTPRRYQKPHGDPQEQVGRLRALRSNAYLQD